MSLIQFNKTAGRKLLLTEDGVQGQGAQAPQPAIELQERHKAAALVRLVQHMGFNVQDLGVQVDGDKVTLTGQVPSQEIREKIVLLVGNVQGIGIVDDHLQAADPMPEAQYYEVRSGDTLSKIAQQFYGKANQYNQIFEANRPMLKDPDELYPGLRLRIPATTRQSASTSARGPEGSSGGSGGGFGGGLGGGYEYCFPAGTRVEMADGSLREISKVSAGSRVRCWNHEQNAPAEARIETVLSGTVDRLVRLNGRLSASPAHRVFSARGYVRFDEVRVGDVLLRSPGSISEPVTWVEVLTRLQQ